MTLTIDGMGARYDGQPVLEGIDLVVREGTTAVLRGENGSGKTTLLRCVLGSAPMAAGTVRLSGLEGGPGSPGWWGEVYGVLDDFTWFPELTIRDHLLAFGSDVDVDDALTRMGVGALGDRIAVSLSSGQLRRAALASALVRPWRVLLLDEPEQRLDAGGLECLVEAVSGFMRQGRMVLVATHSARVEEALADDVLRLPA